MRNLLLTLLYVVVVLIGAFGAISVAAAADMPVAYEPAGKAGVCDSAPVDYKLVSPAPKADETIPFQYKLRIKDCPVGQTFTVKKLEMRHGRGLAIGWSSLAPKGCDWVKPFIPESGFVLTDKGPLRKHGHFNSTISEAAVKRGAVVAIEEWPGACGKYGQIRIDANRTMEQVILPKEAILDWYFDGVSPF